MESDDQQSDHDDDNNDGISIPDVLNEEDEEKERNLELIDNIAFHNGEQRPWSDFTLATLTSKHETSDDTTSRLSKRDRGKSAPHLPISAENAAEDYRRRINLYSTQKRPLTSTSHHRKSQPYQFVQLQRSLAAAGLLNSEKDREQFESDYLGVLGDGKKFELFLNDYYSRIDKHFKDIEQAQILRKSRAFAFEDLVTNFMALDPSRDIKIEFVNDKPSKSDVIAYSSGRKSATVVTHVFDEHGDLFYERRADRLIKNQSKARDEITLYAKKAAEQLHEKFPKMDSVPHRVKIIDRREVSGSDARSIAFQHHRKQMSIITKRRNIIMKMLGNTQKYQMKTIHLMHNTQSNHLNSVLPCHELLSRAKQVEQNIREDYLDVMRPSRKLSIVDTTFESLQLNYLSRLATTDERSERSTLTNTNDKSSVRTTTTKSSSFNDALSLKQVEQQNGRTLTSTFTRPYTAHIKTSWANYV